VITTCKHNINTKHNVTAPSTTSGTT